LSVAQAVGRIAAARQIAAVEHQIVVYELLELGTDPNQRRSR
jgi:hypothetical protein